MSTCDPIVRPFLTASRPLYCAPFLCPVLLSAVVSVQCRHGGKDLLRCHPVLGQRFVLHEPIRFFFHRYLPEYCPFPTSTPPFSGPSLPTGYCPDSDSRSSCYSSPFCPYLQTHPCESVTACQVDIPLTRLGFLPLPLLHIKTPLWKVLPQSRTPFQDVFMLLPICENAFPPRDRGECGPSCALDAIPFTVCLVCNQTRFFCLRGSTLLIMHNVCQKKHENFVPQ